jgi:hypothetical protein
MHFLSSAGGVADLHFKKEMGLAPLSLGRGPDQRGKSMASLIKAWAGAVVLVLVGCSSSQTNPLFGEGTGGETGETGSSDGSAGEADAGTEADSDAAECPPFMFRSGSICVDERPALRADGSQGAAVSWDAAVAICEARGVRLCAEDERETACPGGQWPQDVDGGNQVFCAGPGNTWEWSSSTSCSEGHCVSPCCNSATNPCQCAIPVTQLQSYRCCKTI